MSSFRIHPTRAAAVATIALTVAALTGCASTSPTGDSQTLNFVSYTGGAAGQKYVDLIDQFEEANPGVTVNLEIVPGDATYDALVKSRLQGGTAPDVFEILGAVPGLLPYVNADLLTDLSDQAWESELTPAVAAASAATGDKTYAFISQVNSLGVFYNHDLFDEAGIAVPTDWDRFTAAITAFKDAGVTPLAVGAKDAWPLGVQAQAMAVSYATFQEPGNDAAAALLDGSATFSESPEWRSILEDFDALVKAGSYEQQASGVTWPSSATDFATGNAAMLIQGDFAVPAIREANPDINLGYFALPYVPSGGTPAVGLSFQGMLAIPSAAPHADLAKKFLDFLAQPDVMTEYLTTAAALPSIQGVTPTLDPAVEEILPALDALSIDVEQVGLTPATSAALQAGMQSIIAGNGDVASALAGMDEAQSN